jgi:predicted acylesterase/phospholipase RssA
LSNTNRLELYQNIVDQFFGEVKPKWNQEDADVKLIGKEWIDQIKDRFNDPELTLMATELVLAEVHNFTKDSEIGEDESLNYDRVALVMKGGGIKGLAYVGALEVLKENNYNFNWYTGTSAGAIAAILLGSGHSIDELTEILGNKNFADFKDAKFFKRIQNFKTHKGLYEGHTFVDWIDYLLAKKLGSSTAVTLEELPTRTTVYASRRDMKAYIFDSVIQKSKANKASFAARCSMSIPYVFTPQLIEGLRVIDGGAQNNFPIEALLKLEPNTNFIGLYLGSEHFKNGRQNILSDLVSIWTESSDPEILKEHKDKIVVIDPSPISTMQFKLTQEEKEFLLEAGRLGAINFLDKRSDYDKEDYNYTNRQFAQENRRKKLLNIKKKRRLKFKFLFGFIIAIFLLLAIWQPYVFIILELVIIALVYWILT